MADEDIELSPNMIVSAQEIDEVVSQFRLLNRQLSQQQMQKFFTELPRLLEADLVASGHQNDVCPICFNTFLVALAEEEVAHAMESPAHPVDELGVTKLQNTCGHLFCRKDIMRWIKEGHDSCPSCRQPLVTDEGLRDGALPQPGESWIRPWLVDSQMVARDIGVPAQLPTLSIDAIHALGDVNNTRRQFASMYS